MSCNITDEGGCTIARNLSESMSLRILLMAFNNISDPTAFELAKSLKVNTSLI